MNIGILFCFCSSGRNVVELLVLILNFLFEIELQLSTDVFQIPTQRKAVTLCASPYLHSSPSDKNFLNLVMLVQTEIGFEQLIQLVKRLPETQWSKLKQEVDKEKSVNKEVSDLEAFLLTAPTFTKKQLDEIAKTRKAINQWRTK